MPHQATKHGFAKQISLIFVTGDLGLQEKSLRKAVSILDRLALSRKQRGEDDHENKILMIFVVEINDFLSEIFIAHV